MRWRGCGGGGQGLAWLLDCKEQGLVLWSCFGGQDPAAMRCSAEKPENGRSCWAQTSEKMVVKAWTTGARQPRETNSAVEASELGQPPHRGAASSCGPSLGSRSEWDAGQSPPRLARWWPHSQKARSGRLGPSQAPHISASQGNSRPLGGWSTPSPVHLPQRVAPDPPWPQKWRRRQPHRRTRNSLCLREGRRHPMETGL